MSKYAGVLLGAGLVVLFGGTTIASAVDVFDPTEEQGTPRCSVCRAARDTYFALIGGSVDFQDLPQDIKQCFANCRDFITPLGGGPALPGEQVPPGFYDPWGDPIG